METQRNESQSTWILLGGTLCKTLWPHQKVFFSPVCFHVSVLHSVFWPATPSNCLIDLLFCVRLVPLIPERVIYILSSTRFLPFFSYFFVCVSSSLALSGGVLGPCIIPTSEALTTAVIRGFMYTRHWLKVTFVDSNNVKE